MNATTYKNVQVRPVPVRYLNYCRYELCMHRINATKRSNLEKMNIMW